MTPLPQSPWLLLSLSCSVGPALAFFGNLLLYRPPVRRAAGSAAHPSVSVLVPARNEEISIGAAVESVLASQGVALELLVLDDASWDRTGELVAAASLRDPRVVLHTSPVLPAGWNGKQHACSTLAARAAHEWLCFLDADVRLSPDALPRLLAHAQTHRLDLVSGFPREETGTWLEKLLIPLIHFVLLCYLPLPGLRFCPTVPAFAAGCGQVVLVRRAAYLASGGHAAIRATMHDGLLLPKLLRANRFRTDLVDLTLLATCRMYRSASEVWCGLAKNATEGLAAPTRIVPFTFLLVFGQIVPVFWLAAALLAHNSLIWPALALAAGALVRAAMLWRFRQNALGALLHPAAVAILLVLQWWSLGRKLLRRQAVWKQRAYHVG